MSGPGSAAGEGPRIRVAYAIVFVRDVERSLAFYRDTIGLELQKRGGG